MARNFRVLVLILIFILTLSACSSPKGAYVTSKDDYEYSNPADADEAQFAAGENSMMVRQVIYQVVLKVSVSDVDKTVEVLKERAAELGGYVSNSVRETHNNKPTARITFRIPQAQYPQFLDFARDQGEPGSETLNSLDVTEEFVDLEARLANGRLHEERLLAMLAQTGTVTELLSVEKELARIRENIEVIEGRLRYLKEMTAMAKVEIHLEELPGETDIPGLKPVGFRETLRRSLRALVKSSTFFLDVISFLFIVLAALLPFAIPVALVLWLIIYRRRKNKSAKNSAS